MKESIAKEMNDAGSATGLAGVMQALEQASNVYGAYIGLDVHKETIAVAVAECGRGAVGVGVVSHARILDGIRGHVRGLFGLSDHTGDLASADGCTAAAQ